MSRKTWLLILAAGVLVSGGWACGKFGGKGSSASISDSQVVASVGGTDITFKDWMQQVDMLRVTGGLDSSNAQQVNQVLKSLIDQKITIAVMRKANYTDPSFDQNIEKRLVQAGLDLKETKEKLEMDIQAVERLEKNYKDLLKEALLAQNYQRNQLSSVIVTEKDIRDRYTLYVKKYKEMGRPIPPYNSQVKEALRTELQATKLMKSLEDGFKVDRKEDVIQKYLTTLSPSRAVLGSSPAEPAPAAGKDSSKK